MQAGLPELDWVDWLRRWDAQQSGHLPDREQRFEAMLDVLEVLLPADFLALDLACGPGSISQRILTRFSGARCIAVDLDPVLLALGRGALGNMQGRLRWVEADLRDAGWPTQLGVDQVDAVLSTTALHWLPAGDLVRLYYALGKLVRPGGLLLDGEHLRFAPHLHTLQRVADAVRERKEAAAFAQSGSERWREWWEALEREPAMRDLFEERERRFAWRTRDMPEPILDLHEAALRDAGFREVGVIWQHMDNRVLMAVR